MKNKWEISEVSEDEITVLEVNEEGKFTKVEPLIVTSLEKKGFDNIRITNRGANRFDR